MASASTFAAARLPLVSATCSKQGFGLRQTENDFNQLQLHKPSCSIPSSIVVSNKYSYCDVLYMLLKNCREVRADMYADFYYSKGRLHARAISTYSIWYLSTTVEQRERSEEE